MTRSGTHSRFGSTSVSGPGQEPLHQNASPVGNRCDKPIHLLATGDMDNQRIEMRPILGLEDSRTACGSSISRRPMGVLGRNGDKPSAAKDFGDSEGIGGDQGGHGEGKGFRIWIRAR